MSYFLLKVDTYYGEHNEIIPHVLEAEDRQMVKYWYHKSMKEMGYTDADHGGKHTLENWNWGSNVDIFGINELNHHEWDVLSDYLYKLK